MADHDLAPSGTQTIAYAQPPQQGCLKTMRRDGSEEISNG